MAKRKKGESFVKLTRFMLNHESWLNLSPAARCIYIEIRKRYNGSNNGEIHLSCRDAAQVVKCGKSTATKLFRELMEHGYIKSAVKGKFRHKWASTWILTNEEYNGRHKTDEWVHWRQRGKTSVPQNGLTVPPKELR